MNKVSRLILFIISVGSPICSYAQVHPYLSASLGQANERRELYSSPIYQAAAGIENKRFGVNLSIGYLSQANKTQSLQPGRITLMPLMFSSYIRFPLTQRLSFNGGAGAGWVIANYDQDQIYYQAADRNAMKIKFKTKDGKGTQIFGGFDYKVTRNVTFSMTANYLFFQTSVTKTSEWRDRYYYEQVQDQNVNLDGVSVLASLKYLW